jgi:hypothetical protein
MTNKKEAGSQQQAAGSKKTKQRFTADRLLLIGFFHSSFFAINKVAPALSEGSDRHDTQSAVGGPLPEG